MSDPNVAEVPDLRLLGLAGRGAGGSEPRFQWAPVLGRRFKELISLPRGWDGYLGHPVSTECANFAVDVLEWIHSGDLPPPSLVPGGDGTLQIEWHRNGFDLEIDVLGPQRIHAWRCNRSTAEEEETEEWADISRVAEWVADLVQGDDRDVACGGGSR